MSRYHYDRIAFSEVTAIFDRHTGRSIDVPSPDHARLATDVLNSRVVVHEVFVPAEIVDVTWDYDTVAARPLLAMQTAFTNHLDRTFGERCIAPWDWSADKVPFATQLEWEEEARSGYAARETFGEYRGL